MTGETAWRFRGPLIEKGTDGSCKSAVYTTPAVSGGCVYFGSNDCSLWAVNLTSGARIWNVSLGGSQPQAVLSF